MSRKRGRTVPAHVLAASGARRLWRRRELRFGGQLQHLDRSGQPPRSPAPSTSQVRRPWRRSRRGWPKRSDEGPDVEVNVDGPGTGDGFKLFCNGETDISDASRAIKKEEADACAAKGIEFIELKVGIDGLTVMTNPATLRSTCLNFADLYALDRARVPGQGNWNDARPSPPSSGRRRPSPTPSSTWSAPGRGVGHLRQLHRAGPREDRRERGPRRARSRRTRPRRPGPTTSPRLTTTSSSRASRARRARSAGSASPTPRSRVTRSRRCDRQDAGRRVRRADHRHDRLGQVPALPLPLHLRQRGQGQGEPAIAAVRGLLPRRRHRGGDRGEVRRPGRHRPTRRPSRSGRPGRSAPATAGSELKQHLRQEGAGSTEPAPSDLRTALRSTEGPT